MLLQHALGCQQHVAHGQSSTRCKPLAATLAVQQLLEYTCLPP